MKKILLLCYFFRVCLCDTIEAEKDEMLEINEMNELNDENGHFLNGTRFRTVKKYYCHVDTVAEPEFLLYGTKAWTFPTQDVSLTLSYPKTNGKKQRPNKEHFVLTEFRVILYLEGSYSKGYIRRGGILKEHININFVFRNISGLSYQFYLYGVPKDLLLRQENLNSLITLC